MKISDDRTGYKNIYTTAAAPKKAAAVNVLGANAISRNANDAVCSAAKAKIAIDGYEDACRLVNELVRNPEYRDVKNILDDKTIEFIKKQKFLKYESGIKAFDFLKTKSIGRLSENKKMINNVFSSQRINDLAVLFERINSEKAYQLSLPFYEIETCGLKNIYDLAEILGYINSKPEFCSEYADLYELTYLFEEEGDRIIDFDPERIIPALERLSEYAKLTGENAFRLLEKNGLYNKIILSNGKYVEKINHERLNLLKRLTDTKSGNAIAGTIFKEIPDFITKKEPAAAVLEKNLEILKKYADILYKSGIKLAPLLNFEGNTEKLLQMIAAALNDMEDDEECFQYSILPENSRVLIDEGGRVINVYDKNLNRIFEEVTEEISKNGQFFYTTEVKDKLHDKRLTVVQTAKSEYALPVLSSITTKTKDTTDILKRGTIDGIYEYDRILNDGRVLHPVQTFNSDKSSGYKKVLTGFNGITTLVEYEKLKDGSLEFFDYVIKDKDNNILARKNIAKKKLYNGDYEHIINGRSYIVSHKEDGVSVLNTETGVEKFLNLKLFIKNKQNEFKEILKELPADVLEFAADKICFIESAPKLFDSRISSSLHPSDANRSEIFCVPDISVLLHELGHEKYNSIVDDKEFMEIFEKEQKLFKNNIPPVIQSLSDYFLTPDANNKFGILTKPASEAAAEINVILNTPFFLNETCARTHFLQQYFPETIAFLISRYL